MEFLDTNVIIRYLTNDPPAQARQAYAFFSKLDKGEVVVRTCEGVVVETVQVLSSKALYNVARSDIRTHVGNVIAFKGLRLPNKSVYVKALDIYASTTLDFVDALNVAHMERLKLTTIVSFDRDFDRIPGIARREPA